MIWMAVDALLNQTGGTPAFGNARLTPERYHHGPTSKDHALLSQLKDAHRQMREAIAELASVLSEPHPDFQALSRARMKLTRTSGRWRTLVQCTILPALNDIAPAQMQQLDALRRDAAAFAVRKSDHIARWSIRATEADIAGYLRASADMRRSLLGRVDREAAILYPLLEAKAAAAGVPCLTGS